MKKRKRSVTVKKRDEIFSDSIKTKIFFEKPNDNNIYAAKECFVHGYNLHELSDSIDFLDAIYLNLKGELPKPKQKKLLNAIFVALSNLGPRHPATRGVMNAAVSKTKATHLLPIGLSLLSGDYGGSGEVENAVRFLRKHINKPAESTALDCLQRFTKARPEDSEPDLIVPGFGRHYGSVDQFTHSRPNFLTTRPPIAPCNGACVSQPPSRNAALAGACLDSQRPAL